MSDDRCLNTIIEASGGRLSREAAEAKLDDVYARRDAYIKAGMSDTDALQKAAADNLRDASILEARERATKLMNLQKRVEVMNNVTGNSDAVQARRKNKFTTAKDMFDGVRAVINGIHSTAENARTGVAQAQLGMRNRITGAFANELTKSGLYKIAKSGRLDFEVAQELHELNKEGGNPGISKNDNALSLAKLYDKYGKLSVKSLNDQGAWIGDLPGYIAHTEHNWEKIKDAGKSWKEDLLGTNGEKPMLDQDKTFGDKDTIERNQFLENVNRSLISGEHFASDSKGFKDVTFSGPGNVAKQLSQSRLLHFDGAEGWYNYWKKYGTSNSLMESMLGTFDRSSKTAGLMQKFGTNPDGEFKRLLDRMGQHYTDLSPETAGEVRDFNNKYRPALERRWKEVSGTMDKPVNQVLKNIGQGVRLFQNTTKLGRVVFAHASVPVAKAIADNSWGMSALQSYKDSLEAMFTRGHNLSAEDKTYLSVLGAYNDGAVSHLAGNFEGDFSGKVAAINNAYMRLTGLPQFMNWQHISAQRGLSRWLGSKLDQDFNSLHPGTQTNLKNYGITSAEWDALRNSPHTMYQDMPHLTPNMADNISDDAAHNILLDKGKLTDRASQSTIDKAVMRYKEDLGLQLTSMFSEEARRALNLPGPETRAILRLGQSGSPAGEVMKAIMQFKQWPTELILNTYGRVAYMSQTKGQIATGTLHLAAMLTAAGYLRNSLNAIASGKPVPDPRDPATMGEAFIAGGGGTVFGDTLAAAAKQHSYTGVLESLAGPTGGAAIEGGQHAFDAAHGKPVLSNMEKQAPRQIPGQNLWWLNAAYNHIYSHIFQSMTHEGWDDHYKDANSNTSTKPILQPR